MAILNLVLVEPQIPQNTGNIARTCAATGARLHLVKPFGFTPDNRHLRRAGLDYWHYLDITYYDSLPVFLKTVSAPIYCFTTKAQHCYTDLSYPDESWFLFGREDKGLPEPLLLKHPDTCVRLPMKGGIRSLNLSNAVAVGTYEFLRQKGFPLLENQGHLHEYQWIEEAP